MMEGGGEVKVAWGQTTSVEQHQTVNVPKSSIVSLADIMAEQIQETILKEDNSTLLKSSKIFNDDLSCQDCSRDFELACMLSTDPDCTNDLKIAAKLQREYDRELELVEKFRQSKEEMGVAKVDPYYYLQEDYKEDSIEEDDDVSECATILLNEENNFEFPPCGFVRNTEGVIITKHDREINNRKNALKAMQLPFNFHTSDVAGGRISDKVLNELRLCDKIENRKHIRVKDKDEKATNASSVDALTRLIILKWINAGEIDRVEGVIAMGKESAILHAILDHKKRSKEFEENTARPSSAYETLDQIDQEKPNLDQDKKNEKKIFNVKEASRNVTFSNKEIVENSSGFAIKVYRTSLAGFRNRSEYVKDDFRFKNSHRVMKIWAEKEFINLNRLSRANINCPTAIQLRKHVLLMSLIGTSTRAAPKLKDVVFNDVNMKNDAFQQVRMLIARMFNVCKLVHGDLNEYNLLWHEDTVYVIDVAQGMDISHPRSLVFLLKDMSNVLNFFNRIGAENLPLLHELFAEVTQITGLDPEQNYFAQVENFALENRGVQIRRDKEKPADMEWRLYNSENSERSVLSGPSL